MTFSLQAGNCSATCADGASHVVHQGQLFLYMACALLTASNTCRAHHWLSALCLLCLQLTRIMDQQVEVAKAARVVLTTRQK
jgi:hypothetical protein